MGDCTPIVFIGLFFFKKRALPPLNYSNLSLIEYLEDMKKYKEYHKNHVGPLSRDDHFFPFLVYFLLVVGI